MGSRLINVRLDEERLRKARHLRSKGVVLSELVREAIDQRYQDLRTPAGGRDMAAILRRVYERHPEPSGTRPRRYDVHDAREAREAIRKRLARKTG
jgi:hypothetical protein